MASPAVIAGAITFGPASPSIRQARAVLHGELAIRATCVAAAGCLKASATPSVSVVVTLAFLTRRGSVVPAPSGAKQPPKTPTPTKAAGGAASPSRASVAGVEATTDPVAAPGGP